MTVQSERHETVSGFRPGGEPAPRRAAAGFSLLEVLLATLLLGVLMVAATTALGGAATAHETLVAAPVESFALAREVHSLASVLPRGAGDGLPAASPAAVALLEDLDGATFSPPISAARSSLSHASGWSQAVAIDAVDLADPSAAAPDPAAPGVLLRLTVTVSEGRAVRGTYVWWMSP